MLQYKLDMLRCVMVNEQDTPGDGMAHTLCYTFICGQ